MQRLRVPDHRGRRSLARNRVELLASLLHRLELRGVGIDVGRITEAKAAVPPDNGVREVRVPT